MNHEVSIKVNPDIQLTYRRIKTNLENRFREFIDNALQSFKDSENNVKLKEVGVKNCEVKVIISEEKIEIIDNAFGMDLEAIKRAVRLNAKKENYEKKSLSEFGMGLKYAAIGLGNTYTIESKMLGSNKVFKVTISEELLLSGKETVTVFEKENLNLNDHYTKITITDLIKQITKEEQQDLIKNLESIYNQYLGKELNIIFHPNISLKYVEPELRLNDMGKELYSMIEGKFTFQEKTYHYFGWIGILKKGMTNGAGFTLLQFNRAIVLKYLPQEIFKSKNSFQFQRIIGEINLDDIPVDFNKSSFSWDNGLEKAFLNHLSKLDEIIEFSRLSKTSTHEVILSERDKTLIFKEISQEAQNQHSHSKTNIEDLNDKKEVAAYVSTDLMRATSFTIPFEGIDYTYNFIIEDDISNSGKWLSIVKTEEPNNFLVKINFNFKIFNKISKSEIKVLCKMATVIVTSQISTQKQFPDASKFVQKMNEVIKNWNANE